MATGSTSRSRVDRRGAPAADSGSEAVDEVQNRATEALTAVSRTMTAIVARTLSEVAQDISVPQLRVLVVLGAHGPMNLSTLAQHLCLNASNASRTCDQLVADGRISRQGDDTDRRTVVLRLTDDGTRFVAGLMAARRRLIGDVVARMATDDQRMLAQGLEAFSSALGAAPPEQTVGPPDGRILPWLL